MIIVFLYDNGKPPVSANTAHLFADTLQQHPEFSVKFCCQPDLSVAFSVLLLIKLRYK